MLTREEILAHVRRPVESAIVPEWGGEVWFTPMSGLDVSSIPASGEMADATASAHILVRTVTDENGVLAFKKEDAAALAQLPYAVLKKPSEIAFRINRIGEEAVESEVNFSGGTKTL